MSMQAAPSSSVNHWPDSKCAKAFWGQHELPAYQRLLADTAEWLDPRAGERWLDLGCGCGQLTKALWEKSRGALAEVAALDCAAPNGRVIDRLRGQVQPPADERLHFVHADFSSGLAGWANERFDGVVSGLAIQYAESYSEETGGWTTDAYEHLLREVFRVLKSGGRFVFSVNVPEPAWGKVGVRSLAGILRSPKPGRYLKNMLRMYRYGRWLTRESRRGRFHYLPTQAIVTRLIDAGFVQIEHRLTYCDQAYLVRCRKAR
jgi:SAM-dependent methyltransferase